VPDRDRFVSPRLSRRSFFARVSMSALAGYAAISGARATAAYARGVPPPCRVRCVPVSDTGCACGGNLYRCDGCGDSYHACIDRKPFYGFCLRRECR
jgi:hypothetical protein